jgi:N-acetylneuraminate synthase
MKKKLEPSIKISIDKKNISQNNPVYFIAEIGSNFDNDLNRAKDLIYLAKNSGADAVKFQHYTAKSLVSDYGFKSLGSRKSHQAKWKKSVYKTYKDASLNKEWTYELQETCNKAEISFLTSPYSLELVDYVDQYVPAFKVGSGDITWIEIIKKMASKGKPIILATGASSMEDVNRALDAILNITSDVILLQCNTNYTAKNNNFMHLQLRVIQEFQKLYPGIITGLSDHMPGHVSVLGAVALGAKVIEKHFTDSVDRSGPDHLFSMTPNSWREMVSRTRELELSLGDGVKKVEKNEKDTVIAQRRSICLVDNHSKGDILTRRDLTVLRPCKEDSMPPYEIENIIGKTLKRNVSAGEYIKWTDLI